MSLTIASPLSSLLQSSENTQLLASVNAASSTDTGSIGAITTAALGGTAPGLSGLAGDLANLFKDLASKDVAAAKTDVAQIQKDLGTAGPGSSSSASSGASSPLQKLLTSVTSSLSSGDTAGALESLASFFGKGGSSSGNVVDTTA